MLNEALSKMPEVFEAKILLNGQEYFKNGNVLNIRFSDGLIKARVKGSNSQIYDIHMDLKQWPAKRAHCTCTFHDNCKHAAACLFALRERDHQNSSSSEHRLDKRLDSWLKNLRAQEAYIQPSTALSHHLIYLLDLKLTGNEHKVLIRLGLARLLKRGGYGKVNVFNTLSDSKKQFFLNDDEELVAQLLFKCNAGSWFETLSIRNSELLSRILKTGRAFESNNPEQALHLGDPVHARCEWVLTANGCQNLLLMHEDQTIQPLLLDESWYLEKQNQQLGPLITPYPIKQLGHLLDAPPIPLDQAQLFAEKMRNSCPDFPVPRDFPKQELIIVEPTPVIVFNAISENNKEFYWYQNSSNLVICTAAIFFDYQNVRISSKDKSKYCVSFKEDLLINYQRDWSFENKIVAEVSDVLKLRAPTAWEKLHWVNMQGSDYVLNELNDSYNLDKFYETVLPFLDKLGVKYEFESDFYQEVLNVDDLEWFSEASESKNDFFSYQLGIIVDEKPISIVPLVAELIQKHKGNLDDLSDDEAIRLPLNESQSLQLTMGRIKPLIRLLMQFGMRHVDINNSLNVDKYQLILMREAELALKAARSRWQGVEKVKQELSQLSDSSQCAEIEIPKGLRAELRDYQRIGLNWLQFLRQSRFNGILADDMGLGKTIQTLAHLLYEKEQGRLLQASLIIAPTSLVGNWFSEASRFTPDLKVLVYHGSERHQDQFENYDVVVSTYGLMQRDKDKFIDFQFYYLILDEAQFIKNSRTKTTQIVQQINAHHRLCLSGTPLENHLGELWSLFHFLMPGLLGDAKQFRLWFKTPIEKFSDNNRREILANRVKPFILRRNKNQVAKELPLKTEILRTIEIIGPQRDLYEAIRMSMEKKVRDAIVKQGLGKSHILILDALLKLRQVCCDPRLLSLPEANLAHGSSAKLDTLMELIDNLMEEGRKVLVFSQFTSMLQLIEKELVKKEYSYLKLTGQTQNRQQLVTRFQQGESPIFLISLKAGGTGLNLTRADTVIHYDPWWNPAVEEQATDRTHRIGQQNPVFVYKLITSGTVEETIVGMQERKRQLVDGILTSGLTNSLSISQEDLSQFFVPLD